VFINTTTIILQKIVYCECFGSLLVPLSKLKIYSNLKYRITKGATRGAKGAEASPSQVKVEKKDKKF